MTSDSAEALIVRDDQGNYYCLNRDLFEQCRVPEQERAVLEQQLAQSEVSGYGGPAGENTPQSGPLSLTLVALALVQSPRDLATGHATARRQWEPVQFKLLSDTLPPLP
jgi:hypothetical protein